MLRKYIYSIILIGTILMNFLTGPLSAQTITPITQKTDSWLLKYRVIVQGTFQKEPELGLEGPVVHYRIDRLYEGNAKLGFQPKPNDPNTSMQRPLFKAPELYFHVTINDSKRTAEDPLCNEFETIEENWEADLLNYPSDFPTLLLIDTERLSYQTSFPILLKTTIQSEVKHTKQRTFHSNGTTKKDEPVVKYVPFDPHNYPQVKGFIEKNSIIRSPDWSELKSDGAGGELYWVSETLHPDEPLIEGVPESKNKVNITIYYKLRRIQK